MLDSKKIKEMLNQGFSITNENDFQKIMSFFINPDLAKEREDLYEEIAKKRMIDIEKINEVKMDCLTQFFGKYIQTTLQKALQLAKSGEKRKAYEIIKNLEIFETIFKFYDTKTCSEFISENEPNISVLEVEALLFKPELTLNQLKKLHSSMEEALSKESQPVKSKIDLSGKLINHPIVQAFNQKDTNKIIEYINKDILEGGFYKDLIKAVLEMKEKLHEEAFDSLIIFLALEDITKGFNNIFSDKYYKPEFLKELLKKVKEKNPFSVKELEDLSYEIQTKHSTFFELNSDLVLKELSSSKFSLNDFGHMAEIKGKFYFVHGHSTKNSGNNQDSQHANASLIFKKRGLDPLGITIIKSDIIHAEDERGYLFDYAKHLNISNLDSVLLSKLQFDVGFFKMLSGNKELLEKIEESDIFSTNLMLIKDNLTDSIAVENFFIGKTDLENLIQKKNYYINFIERNMNFLKNVVISTATDKQMLYQFFSEPLLSFINSMLLIENKLQKKVFYNEQINIIQDLLTIDTNNASISAQKENINTLLELRELKSFKEDIKIFDERDNDLIVFSKQSNGFIFNQKSLTPKGHKKALKGSILEYLDYFKKNPLSNNVYSPQYKSAVIKSLKERILEDTKGLLLYNSQKSKRLLSTTEDMLDYLRNNSNGICFAASDYNSARYFDKALAELLLPYLCYTKGNQAKSDEKRENDLTLLSLICLYADTVNSKILLYSNNLDLKLDEIKTKTKNKL